MLDAPTGEAHLSNIVCGDSIHIMIEVDQGIIKNIRFDGVGCAISTASASLLTDFIMGKSLQEVRNVTSQDVQNLLGVELSPSRLKCALLPLEAIHKALGEAIHDKVQ